MRRCKYRPKIGGIVYKHAEKPSLQLGNELWKCAWISSFSYKPQIQMAASFKARTSQRKLNLLETTNFQQ